MQDRHLLLALLATTVVACSPADEGTIVEVTPEEAPPDTSLEYLDDPTARPAFRAGKDYPDDYLELDGRVLGLMQDAGEFERRKAFALVAPHAGYVFSGAVAAQAYARVEVPDTVILVASKHHGEGEPAAFWNEGPFLIPGHAVHVRTDLVERFMELGPEGDAVVDREAYMRSENHPLENQLPFITTINPDVKIVPFSIYDNSQRDFIGWDPERVRAWGKALADLVTELEAAGEEVLVVTTTDLVHRIPLADSEVQDAQLMEHIVDLDIDALHQYVVDEGITICGEVPVGVVMAAAVELGYTDTELTGRDTSFHRQKNPDSVVGYGSAVFWPSE